MAVKHWAEHSMSGWIECAVYVVHNKTGLYHDELGCKEIWGIDAPA